MFIDELHGSLTFRYLSVSVTSETNAVVIQPFHLGQQLCYLIRYQSASSAWLKSTL